MEISTLDFCSKIFSPAPLTPKAQRLVGSSWLIKDNTDEDFRKVI